MARKPLDLTLGVLNGLVGDYLHRTGNGLATEMTLVKGGAEVRATSSGLAGAYREASGRLVLLVHGLMNTEADWEMPDGSDYGTLLQRDLGFTPLYVRYNTGVAIPDNGAALAALLEQVVGAFPVPVTELLLVGYSMGGLVIRSACHVAARAGHAWLALVKRAIYVGTPHLGAPMERVGRVVTKVLRTIDDPYTRLVGEIADLRSDGLKDLGDADVTHEDRERRSPSISLRDPRHPVPLLPQIRHYLVAGDLAEGPARAHLGALFGDAVVPVPSATNGACVDAATYALPPDHVRLVPHANHVSLSKNPAVYVHVRAFAEEKVP